MLGKTRRVRCGPCCVKSDRQPQSSILKLLVATGPATIILQKEPKMSSSMNNRMSKRVDFSKFKVPEQWEN
jgi:hypothetical protein